MNGKTITRQGNLEELAQRLAARRDAETHGSRYDDGCGNRHGGYRERRHGSGRNAYPSLAYAYAYRCVPVLACLLVFAISLGMFRTAVSGSAGGVRDDRYAAIRAQWLAENVVDVKDPPAEPEAAQLQAIKEEVPEAVSVRALMEPGPVQGPMPAYGPAWEPRPEEEPVPEKQEVRQEAAASLVRDAGPAARVQEREAPQEDEAPQSQRADADGEALSLDGMPQTDTGDEALPPEPVLPDDEAVLPVDEMLLQLSCGSDNPCNYGTIWS